MLYSNIRVIIFRINFKYNRKRIIFYNKVSSFLNLLKKHSQSRFVKSQSYYLQKFLKKFIPLTRVPISPKAK
ncbi:hypothetical protein [Leptospira santarosai]|uniref:hypothetical protein n=1 Tax=Leptospira santarosai TaxID=28183 RepID=UPI0002976170|nr:hypothetical protein [Leptospira santarosai]EKS06681.1 hypothetical protein LEP1GSC071_1872 [Leptospira santarosai str. JET]EMJ49698.1 hypothetical protein LEP1GSC169_1620 [Leptospira santarosai str. HAI1349]EMO12435.1 hypothetical protein LEP1GSC165_0121 [Leptospira santarosai str. CBC523]EMO21844.1 hypothetical protein LEP1GSC168_4114 [Leptospira santarosai str. HAI134]EMP00634.1 hypothetical protein LEP1GSC171_3116 [Leptospira santarosai str. HAI1380]